jgi:transitional endoplasmic reticulum ATPase
VNPLEAIDPLRQAVRASPDNVPLRRHLGDVLLAAGRPAEAEQTYREALAMAPGDHGIALGLATAFHALGRHHEAMVLLDRLREAPDPDPRSLLLAARVLLATGERDEAGDAYRAALRRDPSVADAELAGRLGAAAPPAEPPAEPPAGPSAGPADPVRGGRAHPRRLGRRARPRLRLREP